MADEYGTLNRQALTEITRRRDAAQRAVQEAMVCEPIRPLVKPRRRDYIYAAVLQSYTGGDEAFDPRVVVRLRR